MFEYFLQAILKLSDEIGRGDGGTSADSSHAVYEHIRVFSGRFDELIGCFEMLAEIVL
jgi:hypothetical protein